MDKTTLSKYGWMVITIIIVSLLISAAPVLGERANDLWIARIETEHASDTVYLDANGGSVSLSEILVVYGKEYGYLPTPSYEGKTFVGWYMEPVGGEKITSQTVYNGETVHTLYAHWE